jgi:hypothetical protein
MFSYVSPEAVVPQEHPLRMIRQLVNAALDRLSPACRAMYSQIGRPSIPSEQLLRSVLVQAFFSVGSERQLMEQLTYTMMFRWFVGLSMDAPVWDVTVFTGPALGPAQPDPWESRAVAGRRRRRQLAGRDPGRPAGQAAAVGRALLGRRHADRSLGFDEELPAERR